MYKLSFVLAALAAAVPIIIANPYGYAPYTPPVLERITALTIDGSLEIEKIPAPPMPPRDPYEGGARIELNNPDNMPQAMPYMPPVYSMKPKGYGPKKKKYKSLSYYKLPSNGVPIFETTSKGSSYSKSSSENRAKYSPPQYGYQRFELPQNYPQQPSNDYLSSYYDTPIPTPVAVPERAPIATPEVEESMPSSVQPRQRPMIMPSKFPLSKNDEEHSPIPFSPLDTDQMYQANPTLTDYEHVVEYEQPEEVSYYHREPNQHYIKESPDETISQKISQIVHTTHHSVPKQLKDVSVAKHHDGGTIINIPA